MSVLDQQQMYLAGTPTPLGVSHTTDGVNFALFSPHASAVSLCLFPPHTPHSIEIPLDPYMHKTGDVWHVCLPSLQKRTRYGYRVDGPYLPELGLCFDNTVILLDPYANHLDAPLQWGEQQPYLGYIDPHPSFDWENDHPPCLPFHQLVIYEMHIRGFTQDPSSKTQVPGTFLGLIEKIPYLKKLGINAVELMPIYEFREWDSPFVNPKTTLPLCNYWGYAPLNFFSPMRRYGTVEDFKTMVKALHQAGIEVFLDVVYNHTTEGHGPGGIISFKGLANSTYYILNSDGTDTNYSGCGNTFQTNHPIVRRFILDSLRYWVEHMHVDGFRFDLASILTRGQKGEVLASPPIVEEISRDPILAHVKLIAEAWDAAGLYQVGHFPHLGRWAEWNGQYRDVIRRFWKGDGGAIGTVATRLCGSEDLYASHAPYHSINFVTAHDGFSLHDLVSYNDKHNLENGENNRDGDTRSESNNYGLEGPTSDPGIQKIRQKQMRNFLFSLLVSQGVPMLLMGDEYGHTKRGNNNTWGHDSRLNWFQWDKLDADPTLFSFCQRMIAIRKHFAVLTRAHFLKKTDIVFHGVHPMQPDWGNHSHLIAYALPDPLGHYTLYLAFNAHAHAHEVQLPQPSYGPWICLVDTAKSHDKPVEVLGNLYQLEERSCLLLLSASAQHEHLAL